MPLAAVRVEADGVAELSGGARVGCAFVAWVGNGGRRLAIGDGL
jgi:hypothetical protein